MPDVKLAITKQLQWQGNNEEFSNVYVYNGVDIDSVPQMENLIDTMVAAEKAIHASAVTYVRAQVYSFGDIGPNFMYHSKVLSGTGGMVTTDLMYRESCVCLRQRLPRTFSFKRANQPYLRKYLHTCSPHGAEISGKDPAGWTTVSGALDTFCNIMKAPISGVALRSESGKIGEGPWQRCNVVRTRQFRRGRKEYAG